MITYFENLTIRLYIVYILNIYIKFRVNPILFIIRSTNLYFLHNFRFQKLET